MKTKQLEISYIIPVFKQLESCNDLEKLIEIYSQYNSNILDKIHFIFVDDCSPTNISIQTKKLNYSLVRITDDIKWNQGGARNLGVHLSKTSKLILTDLDHIFPESTFAKLIKDKIPNKIYTFNRVKDGSKINSHVNTFFCSKSIYYKSLGVDEEFCGNYGYEDVYFRQLQKHLGTKFKLYRKEMISVFIHNQHNLTRNTEKNKILLNTKLKAIKNKKAFSEHSRKHLSFHWKHIKSHWIYEFESC